MRDRVRELQRLRSSGAVRLLQGVFLAARGVCSDRDLALNAQLGAARPVPSMSKASPNFPGASANEDRDRAAGVAVDDRYTLAVVAAGEPHDPTCNLGAERDTHAPSLRTFGRCTQWRRGEPLPASRAKRKRSAYEEARSSTAAAVCPDASPGYHRAPLRLLQKWRILRILMLVRLASSITAFKQHLV